MAIAAEALADQYARYFFSLFDACLNEDEAGCLMAQSTLEDFLSCVGPEQSRRDEAIESV